MLDRDVILTAVAHLGCGECLLGPSFTTPAMNTRTSSPVHTQTVIAAGRHYACEFQRQRGGGYLVTSWQFLPLAAWGETLDAARENARKEIEAWIEYADCCEFV